MTVSSTVRLGGEPLYSRMFFGNAIAVGECSVILLQPPCTFSRCFNRDMQGGVGKMIELSPTAIGTTAMTSSSRCAALHGLLMQTPMDIPYYNCKGATGMTPSSGCCGAVATARTRYTDKLHHCGVLPSCGHRAVPPHHPPTPVLAAPRSTRSKPATSTTGGRTA